MSITLDAVTPGMKVTPEHMRIISFPIYANKHYNVELHASANVSVVVVVRAHDVPELWDFYGGERIHRNALLRIIDFGREKPYNLSTNRDVTTPPGLEYITHDVQSNSVTFLGTVFSSDPSAMLYFGLMPMVYDEELCEQCTKTSTEPCGFCSGKLRADGGNVSSVNITAVRYSTNCVYWDVRADAWLNRGCKASNNNNNTNNKNIFSFL